MTKRNVGLNERRKWSKEKQQKYKMNLGRMDYRMKEEEKIAATPLPIIR
jgi:hypothetical protein